MIDDIDRKILNLLSQNAKMSMHEISEQISLSAAGIHQRIKKLEDQGFVKGSRIILDYEKLELRTMAFIGVFLEKAGIYYGVVDELKAIPEVLECHFTTGNYSLLVKILCNDNQHLMEVLSNRIQKIQGILRTETFIVLENPIERAVKL
ncbi:MAG TPA: Lrp/AsnC ligand binding domain-containing protein [Saprospiraceae bacterium]|nr:Lrp/AsnC ligand binding domain-containing protein [Saprospiraceae bacterium]